MVMDAALQKLVDENRLTRKGHHHFTGRAVATPAGRIYGGQLMAQSVAAVQQTVDEMAGFSLHSMHVYFLRMGDPALDIDYRVEVLRDGRSYAMRSVVAEQEGKAIFSGQMSLKCAESSAEFQVAMPEVPAAETLISDQQRYRALGYGDDYGWPIAFHPLSPVDFIDPKPQPASSQTWFKAKGVMPDDSCLHQQLLAYASDNPLLSTALRPQGLQHFDPDVMISTVDHSIWFHRSFRVDDWLLFDVQAESSGDGRAMCRGNIFSRDGVLVASVAQEGVLRQR